MPDRNAIITQFLEAAGWSDATQVKLAGDMSPRRYRRLIRQSGEKAILMDAPPESDPSTPSFVRMTDALRDLGCSAPEIYHADADAGLLLLEDLGDALFSSVIAQDPSRQRGLYMETLPLLLTVTTAAPIDVYKPTASDLIDATRLADTTIANAKPQHLERFRDVLKAALDVVLAGPSALSLRDMHAENLIWLPERTGIARIGLLDYQDATLTHPAYDLVSLLTDARTEVDPDLRAEILAEYIKISGAHPNEMQTAFAVLSAQRNLRILGLFARTPSKASLMPRVWRYLDEAVDHPSLAHGRKHLENALPDFAG